MTTPTNIQLYQLPPFIKTLSTCVFVTTQMTHLWLINENSIRSHVSFPENSKQCHVLRSGRGETIMCSLRCRSKVFILEVFCPEQLLFSGAVDAGLLIR